MRPARRWLAGGAAGLAVLLAASGPERAQGASSAVTRSRLSNGMTVLVRENPSAAVVAFSLQSRMGTRAETPETAGISNLVQLMVVRGTASRDGQQIVQAADRMGGTLDGFGDVDTSDVAATALARHWAEMLALVAEVAVRPSFPEGTLHAVSDFLLRQIRNRGDKPYDAGLDVLTAGLFGRHPYAWPPLGRRESLERLGRAELIVHYRRHYVPEALVLAASGRVSAPEVVAEAARLFAALPAGPVPAPVLPPPPATVAARQVLEVPGAQAQILVGALGPTLVDPDYPAMKLLATVLGGGLAGRLFSELRDRQALAYTTTAQYPTRLDRGHFLAQLGTAPDNVERAEAALVEQIARLRREPVSGEELRVAKAYLLGSLAMDRRTNARQAWYLAAYEAMGVGHEFLDRYVAAVRALTAEDVQRVARRYLATLHTVVVRPPAR